MRRRMPLVLALVLVAMTIPTMAASNHEVMDERQLTPLHDFRDAVGGWIDPWLSISGTEIADDHAPWVAFGLYEELAGIRPMPCYYDTYAAYWAVAAVLRAMGQAPTRGQMETGIERVLRTIARAETLDELNTRACVARGSDADQVVDQETSTVRDEVTGEETGPSRVIEIEVTAALQFLDEDGELVETIDVTSGETVLFRLRNSAGFEHDFYIGPDEELEEPDGTTDVGIETWVDGVRELEWIVPHDVSELLFGCTVPGHFTLEHGTFRVAAPANAEPGDAGSSSDDVAGSRSSSRTAQ